MSVSSKKIVTLIPSATEIVAFLGEKKSIIGRSHECDYPRDLNNIAKLTSPKINVEGTSGEIDKQINTIMSGNAKKNILGMPLQIAGQIMRQIVHIVQTRKFLLDSTTSQLCIQKLLLRQMVGIPPL